LVLAANNAESPFPFGTLISTKTYSVVKRITFDGTNNTPKATNGAEQCQWSEKTGKFYISIPEINGPGDNSVAGGVAVIDPKTMKVETTFVISHNSCAGPQGLSLGPDHQALLGCNSPNPTNSTAIIDIRNGNIIATLANESGADEVWYNPGDGQYFLARSSAVDTHQLLGVIDAAHPMADASGIFSLAGAPNDHSVAADPIKNQVYTPIAARGTGATACGAAGSPAALQGCIAVWTAVGKDDQCLAEGAPVITADADGGAVFMNGRCRDRDGHHGDDRHDNDRHDH
jgi:hypothetical protein